MKKSLSFLIFLIFSLLLCSSIYAETQSDDIKNETGLVLDSSEDFEDFDSDFDSIFDEAEDEKIVVQEEVKTESSFLKFKAIPITFTGNLTVDTGCGYIYESLDRIEEYERRAEQAMFLYNFKSRNQITAEQYAQALDFYKIITDKNNAAVGGIFTEEEWDEYNALKSASSSHANDFTGYFTFSNKLYLNARPSKDIAIHGTMNIAFPGYSWALSEFYFDLIFKNRLYFTAGKKATSWGYTRLFNQSTNSTKEYEVGGENTNILFDSGKGTTVMLRFPVWSGTITALAVYTGSSTSPSFKEMFFAGSVEMVVKKVSVNVFGRKETSEVGETKGPVLGLEMKRTILGADVYGQVLARCDNDSKFKDLFKGDVHINSFQRFDFTGGLYKWWDKHDPHVGFNIEYQGSYMPEVTDTQFGYDAQKGKMSDDVEYTHDEYNDMIAYDFGVKRLGKKHNIKVGVEGSHYLRKLEGYVKPGFKVSGIFPYCTWTNGIKWEYGEYLPKEGRFTLGSYLSIEINY